MDLKNFQFQILHMNILFFYNITITKVNQFLLNPFCFDIFFIHQHNL